MHFASLDQCCLRNLLWPPKGDAKFPALKSTLETAVDSGKVICPAHDEMVYESVVLDPARRDAIIAFQNRLSKSFVFRTFYQLLSLDTLKLIRPDFDYLPFKFGDVQFKPGANLKGLAETIRSSKRAALVKVNARPYPPKGHVPGSDLKTVYFGVSRERCGSMYRIAEALLKTGKLETEVEEWDAALGVGEFLVKMQVTKRELEELVHKIIHHVWEQIPALFTHTLLFSRIEQDMVDAGRQFDINDHPDILRLSVALEYAQVAVCDSKIKELSKQTKLGDGGCTVFSIREADGLRNFIELL